jgi:hypothetical protein
MTPAVPSRTRATTPSLSGRDKYHLEKGTVSWRPAATFDDQARPSDQLGAVNQRQQGAPDRQPGGWNPDVRNQVFRTGLEHRWAADGERSLELRGAVKNPQVRQQSGGQAGRTGSQRRSWMRPVRDRERATAVTAATIEGTEFRAGRAMVVHRLPHAARMRGRGRDRHGRGGERPHQQKNQKQSGCQAMHRQHGRSPTPCPGNWRLA